MKRWMCWGYHELNKHGHRCVNVCHPFQCQAKCSYPFICQQKNWAWIVGGVGDIKDYMPGWEKATPPDRLIVCLPREQMLSYWPWDSFMLVLNLASQPRGVMNEWMPHVWEWVLFFSPSFFLSGNTNHLNLCGYSNSGYQRVWLLMRTCLKGCSPEPSPWASVIRTKQR